MKILAPQNGAGSRGPKWLRGYPVRHSILYPILVPLASLHTGPTGGKVGFPVLAYEKAVSCLQMGTATNPKPFELVKQAYIESLSDHVGTIRLT